MKRIIDGKLYDTETAEEIGDDENGYMPDDFHYVSETLYRTKKGVYFLHGVGGAATIYSTQCGTGHCGSERITPYSIEQVITWLQQTDNLDAQLKLFPDSVEEA